MATVSQYAAGARATACVIAIIPLEALCGACDAMTTRTHTKWREEGRGMQDVCTYDIQSAPEVM